MLCERKIMSNERTKEKKWRFRRPTDGRVRHLTSTNRWPPFSSFFSRSTLHFISSVSFSYFHFLCSTFFSVYFCYGACLSKFAWANSFSVGLFLIYVYEVYLCEHVSHLFIFVRHSFIFFLDIEPTWTAVQPKRINNECRGKKMSGGMQESGEASIDERNWCEILLVLFFSYLHEKLI